MKRHVDLEVWLSGALLAVCLAAMLTAASCGWLGRESKVVASTVVDCTTETARDAVKQFGPIVDAMLAQASAGDGHVNWQPIKDVAKGFGPTLGGCVLATVVVRALHPTAPSGDAPRASELVLEATSLRAGFEELRAVQLGGKTFKTDAGTL